MASTRSASEDPRNCAVQNSFFFLSWPVSLYLLVHSMCRERYREKGRGGGRKNLRGERHEVRLCCCRCKGLLPATPNTLPINRDKLDIIYILIYTTIHVHVYMYMCVYVCIMYIFMYSCIYIYLCVHMYIYTYMYLYIYVHVCIYIYKYAYICIYLYMNTYIYHI